MSRIRANQITNQSADGAPTVQNGLVISGVTTSTTFSGSGASLTNLNGSNIASGTVPVARIGTGTKNTSTFYRGDGSFATVTSTTINNNADNRIITGSGTANTLEGESTITYANPNLEINTDTSPYGCLILNGNSGGLVQFEDNEVAKWSIFGDHALNFYNNANSLSRLYINSSGQMGLGVEPNTNWPSNNDYKALQLGTGACVFGRGSGDEDRGGIAVNWYSDGSNNKYLGNGNAARIYLADGNIYFSNAAANSSGANSSMTLNDRLIIDSDGNVHINNSNNLKKFSVREGSTSSGVYYNAHIGGASHLANYAVGIGFDPEGYPARTKIGIVAEGTSTGYSRGKLHFLLDNANDSGEATLSEARMTITDSGQVTKPYQVSFAAMAAQNGYVLNGQVFPFNTTTHNIGSHFNTGNYRFTAPVAGRYLFTFYSILNSSGQGRYEILINGAADQNGTRVHMTPNTTNWDHVSTSWILNLAANDYIQMYSQSNTGWHGNHWQRFCGELLS